MMSSVLVYTSDTDLRHDIENAFRTRGYDLQFEDKLSSSMLTLIEKRQNIFIIDIEQNDQSHLDLIRITQRTCPKCNIVAILENNDFDYLRQLSELAIYYYMIKPLNVNEIDQVLSGLERLNSVPRHIRCADIPEKSTRAG